jgi:chloramphenicol 3-O phosphotransferase
MPTPGQIVILNGAPRSGKSTIARAIQDRATSPWFCLGADASIASTPERLQPGVGLRPGGERPDLEDAVVLLSAALYGSVAAHARLGLDVVVDAGLHDAYSQPRGLVLDCARRLAGLPVLFVGVRCDLDEIWRRREATWGQARATADAALIDAVARWQEAVHAHPYDLEVDATVDDPGRCADLVLARLSDGAPGSALARASG